MSKRLIAPLVIGLVGAAILVSLGVWQIKRLAWKEALLAGIEARLHDAPMALPAAPDPARDRYAPVWAEGSFTGPELHVLSADRESGPGYRIIAAFRTTDGRMILIDRGFVPEDQRDAARVATAARVAGTLFWPDETDSFTPVPDLAANIWFARDVPAMAAALDTEPTFIVAREPTGDGIKPVPVDTAGIPNDHRNYAITWFSLAFVWLGMTVLWLWRIRRQLE
ncbi:SURF1 family protein [Tabrizicola sp. J26]|uniref:SURF1 family protein n=1 Tax=Alitabrizicola rongguiensis TaxID=2909234 RepID=UPI001F1D73A9|nr:SURF1 family protein [Tabrizicola rongguiensis]MCF1708556.1 SURF1 family protein [Tabrizicola rongguiensis]